MAHYMSTTCRDAIHGVLRRARFALILLLLVTVSAAAAQESTPEVPFATAPAPSIITQLPDDARAAACNAYQRPNFVPHVVRPGDTLANLLSGSRGMTVTQVAALNCIDDPNALPVGSVIFLPAAESVESAAMIDSGDPAAIVGFAANAEEALNTDTLVFSWTGTGNAAYFFPCPSASNVDCPRPSSALALPVEGAVVVDGFAYSGAFRYGLEIVGAGDPAYGMVTVEVSCAQEWLGGVGALPLCPEEPPRNVFAAWQPFENGIMLWFSDVGQIYVLNGDGTFRIFSDTYVEGMPESPSAAPEGLLDPVRGFGMVWDSLGGETSGLGWATAPEQGFDSARQPAGRISYTTYIQGPKDEIIYALTELPNAEVGYWSQLPG